MAVALLASFRSFVHWAHAMEGVGFAQAHALRGLGSHSRPRFQIVRGELHAASRPHLPDNRITFRVLQVDGDRTSRADPGPVQVPTGSLYVNNWTCPVCRVLALSY